MATSQGGGQPVSASTSGMVDPYTGDFHYSVALLTVPGPNGENVNISANYHGGIRVDEKSSWLGLGWDYNPGEISRQVIGAPDDANGYVTFSREKADGGSNPYNYTSTYYFGSLYSKNIGSVLPSTAYNSPTNSTVFNSNYFSKNKSMDVLDVDRVLSFSERNRLAGVTNSNIINLSIPHLKKYSFPYRSLAYDQYMISSPGLSGKMKPYYFGNMALNENLSPSQVITINSSNPLNKKAQFYFENSTQKNITQQSSTDLNSQNMVKSGVYIKYYTNTDINSSGNLYSNSTQTGFLDYKIVSSGNRRDLTKVPADGLGAFEVTDPNGMTYHYSLAVYSFEELEKTVDAAGYISYIYKPYHYANSWKLTAVTGPDYQDANNDHVADLGDSGYWVAYNYSLWSDSYLWTNSQYNLKDDIYYPTFDWGAANSSSGLVNSNYIPNVYKPKKSVVTGKTEVYYLNQVQTASHTALFVKSIRKDEQSYDAVASSGATKPAPLLKLDKIILLKNEDLGTINSSTFPLTGSDLDSRFSYASCSAASADSYFMNASKYYIYKNSIDPKSLKSVEFSQDYSLCQKYACNINNQFTGGSTYMIGESPDANPMTATGPVLAYRTYSSYTAPSAPSTSGKLTLNSILFLDIQNERVTPSIDFDYASTDASKNPDYDGGKTDLWGYYKSDWATGSSHNVSVASKDHTDAWSLRQVTSPLGGKTQIEYESDDYTNEGFVDDPYLYLNPNDLTINRTGTEPYLIFPITNMVLQDHEFNNFIFENTDFANFTSATLPNYDVGIVVVPSKQSCTYFDEGAYVPYYTVNNVSNAASLAHCPSGVSSFPYTPMPGLTFYTQDDWVGGVSIPDNDIYGACLTHSGASFSIGRSNAYAYVVVKATKLYGGGIRVKTIKTVEPVKNSTFTESFTYNNGYCPEVPKKLAVGALDAPTYYSLLLNNKMAIEGLSSNVGYETVTVKNISQNNVGNGSVVFTFNNSPILNPIHTYALSPTTPVPITGGYCNTYPGTLAQCSSDWTLAFDYTNPSNSTSHFHDASNYTFNVNLQYDNEELLGLGQLNSQESFAEGSSSAISSTIYNYDNKTSTYLGEDYGKITFNDQEYFTYKWYTCTNSVDNSKSHTYASCYTWDFYNVYSNYINRDCFLTSTRTTRDGISITEEILTRDANTGTALKTRTTDPTQGIFITNNKQAYLNTSYTALGLKSVNEAYKNQPNMMETSQTLRFPYNLVTVNGIDEVSDPGSSIVVSESKNTYTTSYPYRVYNTSSTQYENSTQTKNWWRLYETYNRLLDDVTSYSSTSYQWRKLSEGTLYDLDNNKIEEKGLNDRKAASKWGYNNLYKLADISNANYNSFTFTGFEDKFLAATNTYHFGGEVTGGQYQYTYPILVEYPGGNPRSHPSVALINPHTGNYLVKVPASTEGPAFNTKNFETGRTYTAKVWVHTSSSSNAKLIIELNGYINPGGGGSSVAVSTSKEVSKTSAGNITVGNWVLMSVDIIVPDKFDLSATHNMKVYLKNASTSGDAFFDDFAFHPKDAMMGGNVYEERTGLLKAQLDNDNFATLYNYDNAGRVISTYKEYSGGIKKVSENQYHFSKP